MIDLTPLDVRKKRGDFRRLLRGYDPEEVDTFMDLVAERLEELVRDNLALSDKAKRLESQLSALEGREKAIQEALVSAQKLREEVRDQSQRDAEVMKDQAIRTANLQKAEAEAEIGRRLGEAEGLIRERQRALEDLERSRLKFLKSFRGLLERELDAVEVEEARRPLEDVPLELEFRGWMPTEVGAAEGEEALGGTGDEPPRAEDDPAFAEEVSAEDDPASAEEVSVEDDAAFAEEVSAEDDPAFAEEAAAEQAPAFPDEAPVLTDETGTGVQAEDSGSDEDDPGGFATQILDVPPPPDLMEAPTQDGELEAGMDGEANPEVGEEGAEPPSAEAEPEGTPPDKPRWLFTLLKREEEREGSDP